MELTPVESSHIAAIGYLEKERVLLVRYKDGALYAFTGWSSSGFQGLMEAQSIGRSLKLSCPGPGVLITKGGAEDSQSTERSAPLAAENAGPLNVIDEDAGLCCKISLAATFGKKYCASKPQYCQTCSTQFLAEMVGAVRYWRIHEHIAVVTLNAHKIAASLPDADACAQQRFSVTKRTELPKKP